MAVKKSTAAAVPALVTDNVDVVASPSPKAQKVKKSKAVVAPLADVDGVAVVPTEGAVVLSVEELFKAACESLRTKITTLETVAREAKNDLKNMEKEFAKHMKASGKRTRKAAAAAAGAPKRPPSGFAKPSLLSDELCAFLKMPNGSEMSRTDVTGLITAYVKSNNLVGSPDKRVFLVNNDPALKALFKTSDTDVVNYFNLQRFISRHFIKKVGGEAVPPPVPATV